MSSVMHKFMLEQIFGRSDSFPAGQDDNILCKFLLMHQDKKKVKVVDTDTP